MNKSMRKEGLKYKLHFVYFYLRFIIVGIAFMFIYIQLAYWGFKIGLNYNYYIAVIFGIIGFVLPYVVMRLIFFFKKYKVKVTSPFLDKIKYGYIAYYRSWKYLEYSLPEKSFLQRLFLFLKAIKHVKNADKEEIDEIDAFLLSLTNKNVLEELYDKDEAFRKLVDNDII